MPDSDVAFVENVRVRSRRPRQARARELVWDLVGDDPLGNLDPAAFLYLVDVVADEVAEQMVGRTSDHPEWIVVLAKGVCDGERRDGSGFAGGGEGPGKVHGVQERGGVTGEGEVPGGSTLPPRPSGLLPPPGTVRLAEGECVGGAPGQGSTSNTPIDPQKDPTGREFDPTGRRFLEDPSLATCQRTSEPGNGKFTPFLALGVNGPILPAVSERPEPLEARNLGDSYGIVRARGEHRKRWQKTAPRADTTGWFQTKRGNFIKPSWELSRWLLFGAARRLPRGPVEYETYLQRWSEKHNFPIRRGGDWKHPKHQSRYLAVARRYTSKTEHDLAERCKRVARGELKFGLQPLAQTRATQLEPPPTPKVRTLTIERRDISLSLGEAAGD